MKSQIRKYVLGLVSLAVMVGCQKGDQNSETADTVLMPWVLAGDNSASLYYVKLEGVSDWSTLTGQYAEFFFSPQLCNGDISGYKPKMKFSISSGGHRIAEDALALQLTAVYAHMQNMAKMDNEVGAGGVNQWPRKVGVALETNDGSSNNAFYDGSVDAMLFIPYSGPDLAIAVNGGILAHEHFHSLFYKTVLKDLKVKASADITTAVVVLRGTNEGLADFWGWLYTDNTEFISMSLPSEVTTRSLSPNNFRELESGDSVGSKLRMLKLFRGNKENNYEMGYAYTLGNQLAKFMRNWTVAEYGAVTTREQRIEVGAKVFKALKTYASRVRNTTDLTKLSTLDFAEEFLAQSPTMTVKACNAAINALNISVGSLKYSCTGGENAPNTLVKGK